MHSPTLDDTSPADPITEMHGLAGRSCMQQLSDERAENNSDFEKQTHVIKLRQAITRININIIYLGVHSGTQIQKEVSFSHFRHTVKGNRYNRNYFIKLICDKDIQLKN